MKPRFYVYRLFDEAAVTLYVGKGSGRRLRNQMRAFHLFGEVIEWFAVERAAYAAERRLIADLRPALNRCGGGNGSLATKVRVSKFAWQREIDAIGIRQYAAKVLMRYDLSAFLPAQKIERITAMAHG